MVLTGQEAALRDRPRRGLSGEGAGPVGMAPAYGASPRHRIEPCAMAMSDLRARIRAAGVIPVAQAVFLWEYGDGYPHDYGPERSAAMFPVRSLLRGVIPLAQYRLGEGVPLRSPYRPICSDLFFMR